jgi:phage baseplate assembly protein W
MTTRADNYTQTQNAPDLFSDFLNDLTPHPITKDITRLKNEQAIKQSLRSIVLTSYGERFFQPNIGSDIKKFLFEPNDVVLAENVKFATENAIRFHEPRVNILGVEVNSFAEEDRLSVNIVFSIINSINVQNLNLILRRVR